MAANLHSCELLREVGRVTCGGGTGRVAALAASVDDWDATLELAREHRVLPFLYTTLKEAGFALPVDVEATLEEEFRNNMWFCMANAKELIGLLGEFRRASIRALPFKGVALAACVYGDYTARNAGDLDLMIGYEDLLKATALMQARGYVLETDVCADGSPANTEKFEYEFKRPADGVAVELRWQNQYTVRELRRNPGLEWFWAGRRTGVLAGMEVPELQKEQMLLLLCLHGSKHVWSRLVWICDVAKTIASEPRLDWDEVLRQAKGSGLRRVLAFGVLLARRVTGVEVPAGVLRGFAKDRTLMRMVAFVDANLFDRPGAVPGRRLAYDFRLLDFGGRARIVLSPEFLRPTHADRAFVHLPKPFDVLYPLVRPVRILVQNALKL